MSSYQFTPQAVEDLFEIWSHIAGDDLDAANRVEDAVHAACALLAETPRAGSVREDLTALPLRFWLVKPYRSYWIATRPTNPREEVNYKTQVPTTKPGAPGAEDPGYNSKWRSGRAG